MVKEEQFAAAKLQTVIGTPVAVVPATDYIQFSEFDLEANSIMEKVKILSGKFSSEPSIPGNMNVNVKGKIPFCSAGLETPPEFGLILQAGGFAATIDTTPTNGSKYIYTRSMTSKDFSAGNYKCQGANAIINTASSIMLNSLKIGLETGKAPLIDFSGVGVAGGLSVDFETVGAITKPSDTKIEYYKVNDLEETILDTDWEFTKVDFEFTNKVSQKSIMRGLGFGSCEIGDQESKFSGSIFIDTALSVQPLNRIRSSNVPGVFSVTFGSIPGRRITISTTMAQLQTTKPSTQGDILTADLSGEFIDNTVVITVNSDIT